MSEPMERRDNRRRGFVHLQVHSEFSLVDGVARIPDLIARARATGMPAVALTEHGNLFSFVRFYSAALEAGIKPIIGCDIRIAGPNGPAGPFRTTLLCQTTEGFRRLARLVSRSYTEGQRAGVPEIPLEWLANSEGLIALAGGASGPVGSALLNGDLREAEKRLARWQALFPDRFYFDVQRLGRPREEEFIFRTVELACRHEVPVVATNDVRFIERKDFEAHEARVCIHEGRTLADPRRPRLYTEQQFLRSPEEMAELFADLPEAVENTIEIARRCNVELRLGEDVLPEFPVPGGRSADDWFEDHCRDGLEERLEVLFPAAEERDRQRPLYYERLRFELEVITGMGFSGYYLIVADFIDWARKNRVPVGPGRGSGAGSLCAYALRITDLDPIAYNLLFERFLNPERVSMPDFDIDFCMEGRDRVIEYVASRYGSDRVSQIITFGTMAARAVVRDVGRVLGHPYGYVDQLARLIPFELGMTLDRALEQEESLGARYQEEEEVRVLIDLARSLEGIARNAGKHAGGVVIAPGPLTDYTPLYSVHGGGLVTQLDKDDVAAVGLVKFDFLGLRTLTILDWAVDTINRERDRTGEPRIDLATLPTDDTKAYELIQRAETTAVFQLESRGMRELIHRLQPDCFEDVIALVALFRPGPLQSGMVDDFIERKHGRAPVIYPHPDLEPILRPTYGVILYQEQVMQIARVLAGYSLGGADILRKAMGKKQPQEMAKQRAVFLSGAKLRGVEEETASHIFDLMEKFAGYGFNRSHSAAYALLAYQTAWLKAHCPAAFMAAVLSADMDHTEKVVVFIDECRAMGLQIEAPDVNVCDYRFSAAGSETIRYGLGAIKGLGKAAVEALLEERHVAGVYPDLYELCRRVDSRKVNRRAYEALIRSGALDALGETRAGLMAQLGEAIQAAEQHERASQAGQDDMFGGVMAAVAPARVVSSRSAPGRAGAQPGGPSDNPFFDSRQGHEWEESILLTGEKETLGLYLSGHPISRYLSELEGFVHGRLSDMSNAVGQTRICAGLILTLRILNSRRGKMAIATLDDGTGRLEAVIYSDVFARVRNQMAKDRIVVVAGEVNVDEMTSSPSMSVQSLYDLESARAQFAKCLSITLHQTSTDGSFLDRLADVLQPYRNGTTMVKIQYDGARAMAGITLGADWQVRPCDELLAGLRDLAGSDSVRLQYSL